MSATNESPTHRLVGQYVVPKVSYWNPPTGEPTHFPFYYLNRFGEPSDRVGNLHIMEDDIPIWSVHKVFPNGLLEVQTTFYMPKYKYGSDYIAVRPETITDFVVYLCDDAPATGALGDPSEERVGYVVDSVGDADDQEFFIEDKYTGEVSQYSKENLDIIDASNIREQARQIRNLLLVSRRGFLPSLPENVERTVFSQVSGYPERMSLQNALRNLRLLLEGRPPQHPHNIALEAAPLPHGPTEENFAGGQRKKKARVGTTMARRGTRKSRGIFSRLYSPIGHLLAAGKESVGAVTNTAKGVVGEGIGGLDKIGRSVTRHANMAVKDVFTRKRKGGGSRKSRKSRRNTRRRR